MNDQLNRNLICSIVFIKLDDLEQYPHADQINFKYSLNQLVTLALKEYAHSDRVILDMGDAIVIAYLASTEDVLAIATDIGRGIRQHNLQTLSPWLARIGIHQGAVSIVKDINHQLNVFGKGIAEAQQIAELAKNNAIFVSPAFYTASLPLPLEIASQYVYSGLSTNSQVSDYNVYELSLITELNTSMFKQSISENHVNNTDEVTPLKAYQPAKTNNTIMALFNWKYMLALGLILLGIWMLVKLVSKPMEPKITLNSPELIAPTPVIIKPNAATQSLNDKAAAKASETPFNGLLPNESIEQLPEAQFESKAQVTINKYGPSINVKETETTIEAKPLESRKIRDGSTKKRLVQGSDKKQADQTSTTQDDKDVDVEPSKNDEHVSENAQQDQLVKESSSEIPPKQKSSWEAFKEGIKRGGPSHCSQAETALGQCR